MRFFAIVLLMTVPFSAHAEGDFLSRRDAFLLLWESINRPAFDTATSYSDVLEDARGYRELSYAKRRGILPDEDSFRPDEPVVFHDALLWLYRTRNVRQLKNMTSEDLPSLSAQYPVLQMNRSLDDPVTREQLSDMIMKLDGLLAKEVHQVSFYADDFHGLGTAFGETFDMYEITAAHRTLPHNTLVKVTNVENGESVIVRINDRGPYVHGRNMDLSKASIEKIAHAGQGVIRATFERLGDVELASRCEQKPRRYQKRVTRDVHFFRGIPHTFTEGDELVLQSSRPFVVQSVTYPDGFHLRVQDFVHPGEKYRFTPDSVGSYTLLVGDALGSLREMQMTVSACALPNVAREE